MACGNLGIANDFNIFVFGDHTQSNVDSEGRVAVGGNATYTDYGVGSSVAPISTDRADLIVQGATGVKGYVSEPYTFALCRVDILFDRYTSGRNLAESFWAATPLLKWKDIVIGDPLCAPYAK